MTRDTLTHAAALSGLGLAAGLVGALAMSGSQKAEMAITGRKPSDTPAKAVEEVTGTDVQDPTAEQSLSTAGHLAFGTALGLGLAAMEKVPEPARTIAFFAAAWGAGTSLITGLGLSDPPTKWDRTQLATDLGHHAVYAASAATAFYGLRRLAKV
ncbi:hypothetical protein [uncultured Sphingomonas sp.]|uniref:hypothetical protein n=1 Tax=uncultured Sphingomonas sp. TaxID=158754 RepID=UPI0025D82C57|nr:hypothetical protein [uncultured Sphingomonas sp.]